VALGGDRLATQAVLTVKDDSAIRGGGGRLLASVIGALCVVIPITKHLLEGDRLLRTYAFNSSTTDGLRVLTCHYFLQQFRAFYDEVADTELFLGVLPNGEDNIAFGNDASDGPASLRLARSTSLRTEWAWPTLATTSSVSSIVICFLPRWCRCRSKLTQVGRPPILSYC
jgi:hypothetical protein